MQVDDEDEDADDEDTSDESAAGTSTSSSQDGGELFTLFVQTKRTILCKHLSAAVIREEYDKLAGAPGDWHLTIVTDGAFACALPHHASW